jgi:hypothetical protein
MSETESCLRVLEYKLLKAKLVVVYDPDQSTCIFQVDREGIIAHLKEFVKKAVGEKIKSSEIILVEMKGANKQDLIEIHYALRHNDEDFSDRIEDEIFELKETCLDENLEQEANVEYFLCDKCNVCLTRDQISHILLNDGKRVTGYIKKVTQVLNVCKICERMFYQ